MFFKNCVFSSKFGELLPISIDPFCFSIDRNFFKFDRESLCLFWSIEADFRSIETRETGFLKRQIGLFKVTFSNSFSTFLSLRVGSRLHHQFFCRFPSRFLQGFCPWRPVSPFCSSFSILFLDFMHFSCIIMGIFGTFKILRFLMIQTYFGGIDQWVFVLWCYNDVPYSLIWSILWFLKNWKF